MSFRFANLLRMLSRTNAIGHWKFFRRYRLVTVREVALVFALATTTVVAEAMGMALVVPLLKFVEQGRDSEKFAASSRLGKYVVESYASLGLHVSLLTLSVTVMFFILLRQAVNYSNTTLTEQVKWSVGRRLSVLLFHDVLASSGSHIRKYKAGEFSLKVDGECQTTAAIVRTYATLWMSVVAFAGYGTVLFVTAPIASVMTMCVILIAMFSLRSLMRKTRRLSNDAVDMRRDSTDFLNERFRAWKLVKLAGTLNLETKKYDEIAARIVDNRLRITRTTGLAMLATAPIMFTFLLGTIYLFIEVLSVDIATVIVFGIVLVRLAPLSRTFQQQFIFLNQYEPSLRLIDSALRSSDDNRESLDTGQSIEILEKEIRFEDVSFQYPDRSRPALSRISVSIPARSFVALIGPSGAGKSTFVDLIPRLIDPSMGRILFDEYPSQNLSLRSLRNIIAFVPQDPFLFDASIADNIRYLKPNACDLEVRQAAKLANASDFIERLPQEYEARLGDSGARLSGGQKQRIVLARAFLKMPQILILDEPTSALDYESEDVVRAGIESLAVNRSLTVIVIAHRLSTVRRADFVIQLKDGELVRAGRTQKILSEIDNPDELFKEFAGGK